MKSLSRLYRFIPFICFLLTFCCSTNSSAAKGIRITLKNGKPISEQIIQDNTIYIIKCSIDLGGKTITLPENCILRFERKGKLCNGTLIANGTIIEAKKKQVFDRIDISTNGTWNTPEGYPEWFGAANNPEIDSKLAIQKAIDVSNTCVLSQNYYTSFDTPTGRGDDKRVCAMEISKKNLIGLPSSKLLVDAKFSNTERTSVFWVGDNVTVDGVNIEYYNTDFSSNKGVRTQKRKGPV